MSCKVDWRHLSGKNPKWSDFVDNSKNDIISYKVDWRHLSGHTIKPNIIHSSCISEIPIIYDYEAMKKKDV